MKTTFRTIKEGIKQKYAWPGMYPLFVVMDDGDCMCVDCARKNFRYLATAWREHSRCGWRPAAIEVNWEDTEMICCNCNKPIESAYGEDK